MVFWKCNLHEQGEYCHFTHPDKLIEEFNKQQLIQKVEDTPKLCSRCDIPSATCEKCVCGSGIDCVTIQTCQERCVPQGKRYMCNYKTEKPECKESPDGNLNKDNCDQLCQPSVYAKCNYKDESCVPCTPWKYDPDCRYTMGQCKVLRN